MFKDRKPYCPRDCKAISAENNHLCCQITKTKLVIDIKRDFARPIRDYECIKDSIYLQLKRLGD